MKATHAFLSVVAAQLLTPGLIQAQQPEPAGQAASAPAATSAKKATLEPAALAATHRKPRTARQPAHADV